MEFARGRRCGASPTGECRNSDRRSSTFTVSTLGPPRGICSVGMIAERLGQLEKSQQRWKGRSSESPTVASPLKARVAALNTVRTLLCLIVHSRPPRTGGCATRRTWMKFACLRREGDYRQRGALLSPSSLLLHWREFVPWTEALIVSFLLVVRKKRCRSRLLPMTSLRCPGPNGLQARTSRYAPNRL